MSNPGGHAFDGFGYSVPNAAASAQPLPYSANDRMRNPAIGLSGTTGTTYGVSSHSRQTSTTSTTLPTYGYFHQHTSSAGGHSAFGSEGTSSSSPIYPVMHTSEARSMEPSGIGIPVTSAVQHAPSGHPMRGVPGTEGPFYRGPSYVSQRTAAVPMEGAPSAAPHAFYEHPGGLSGPASSLGTGVAAGTLPQSQAVPFFPSRNLTGETGNGSGHSSPSPAVQMLMSATPFSGAPAPSVWDAAQAPKRSNGWLGQLLQGLLHDPDDATCSNPRDEVARPMHQIRFGFPEDDLPLLEELGIYPRHIALKGRAVLNPFGIITRDVVEDTDLAGPIAFAICLAFLLTFQGKIQFSAIYGLSVVGIVLFKALFTLLSDSGAPLQFIISSLGYALIPSVLLALLRTVQYWLVGPTSQALLPLALVVIVWSSWCATSLIAKGLNMEAQRYLVLYPMFLFYSVFAALTIF